jgi:hypothetical protein
VKIRMVLDGRGSSYVAGLAKWLEGKACSVCAGRRITFGGILK